MDDKKKEFVVKFIKEMDAIEEQIKPYQQHKRDLRTDYEDNKWLTKKEMWAAIRAWRFAQKGAEVNIEDFNEMYEAIKPFYEED